MKNLLAFSISTLFFRFFSLFAADPFPAPTPESVVILGSGIGALTSAIYLARAGAHPLVIEGKTPGGLLTQSHSVQNWSGEMEIGGEALMEKVRSQAVANGARFMKEELVNADFSHRPFVLTTRSLTSPYKTRQILAESCVIGMGTTPNFLGIPGEKTYWGGGVTNCAICDGSLYQGQTVGVVGGGDAAILEALYLSKIAKEVHLFVRKSELRANERGRVQILMEQPNVVFHYNTEVQEVKGDGKNVTGVLLKSGSTAPYDFSLNGLFLAIGSRPNSELFKGALDLDENGYIALKKDQETSVPGVYAMGDIADPIYKQAISAAGDGAKAALQSHQFLMDTSAAPQKEVQHQNSQVDPGDIAIEVLSSQQFAEELKRANSPVIVDFYATWCSPCKQISSLIESSAQRLAGKVKILKINVDKVADLPRTYEIRAMPTVLFFDKSGKVLERKVGAEQISDFLEQLTVP